MQGVLEAALAELFGGTPAPVIGAGRTDTGVHATGQVVSFRTASRLPEAAIRRGVNALLPVDVAVRALVEVPEGFHARYAAVARTYKYTIWNGEAPRPLLRRTALWVETPLDVGAMAAASAALIGRHDFSAFARSAGGGRERSCRRAAWTSADGVHVFEIEADGFLRGMVRGIVGTLLRVGLGRLDAAEFADILASRDRARGGQAAPPQGLCLAAVEYPDTVEARPRVGEEDEGDE